MLTLENKHNGIVCGIDEAGRGPLAGPVIAACVHIPAKHYDLPFWREVNDSKKLTKKKREDLFTKIRDTTYFGIAEARADEIDKINIHHASLLAMERAFKNMCGHSDIKPTQTLIDGKFSPGNISCETMPVIKGDSVSLSIAAASILAKVTRDKIMLELHNRFPVYGWDTNAGYGTAKHLQAMNDHGITKHHRQSYAPVRRIASS